MEEPANNKVAIYVRVSSEEQVNGYSIDAQLESLRAYASLHQLSTYKEYIDAGYSAKSIDGRPAIQELLKDAGLGRFHQVVSWKINRLSRNLENLLSILEVFKQKQIKFVSLTEQFESDTPQGNFILQMMGSVAELEREQISQNVRLGMSERNKQGKWNCGNNVLGYEWVSVTNRNDSYVRVIPKERELVRLIFTLYKSGLGLKAITNRLNTQGYRTKKGKPFSNPSVRGILTNVNYIGKIRYTIQSKLSSGQKLTQIIDGIHEPIIDRQLWNEVQSLRKLRCKPMEEKAKRFYPLSGILKCPSCGQSMVPFHVRNSRKDGRMKSYHYYICGNYNNSGAIVCKANAIPAKPIEDQTYTLLQALLTEKTLFNQIIQRVHKKMKETTAPILKELEQITTDLRELKKRQKRCFELFEDGHISRDDFVRKVNELSQQEKDMAFRKQQLEERIEGNNTLSFSPEKLKQAIESFLSSLQFVSQLNQKTLVRSFIQSIHVPQNRDLSKVSIRGTAALHYLNLLPQKKGKISHD